MFRINLMTAIVFMKNNDVALAKKYLGRAMKYAKGADFALVMEALRLCKRVQAERARNVGR